MSKRTSKLQCFSLFNYISWTWKHFWMHILQKSTYWNIHCLLLFQFLGIYLGYNNVRALCSFNPTKQKQKSRIWNIFLLLQNCVIGINKRFKRTWKESWFCPLPGRCFQKTLTFMTLKGVGWDNIAFYFVAHMCKDICRIFFFLRGVYSVLLVYFVRIADVTTKTNIFLCSLK